MALGGFHDPSRFPTLSLAVTMSLENEGGKQKQKSSDRGRPHRCLRVDDARRGPASLAAAGFRSLASDWILHRGWRLEAEGSSLAGGVAAPLSIVSGSPVLVCFSGPLPL